MRAETALRRLFPAFGTEEKAYYARTGVFPIMHAAVIKREVLEAHPWVASTLFKAFEAAKQLALADLTQTSALPVSLPFLVEHAYQTVDLMGDDFWPYGLEANRATLETFVRYAYEQGIATRPLAIEELFAVETLDTFRN